MLDCSTGKLLLKGALLVWIVVANGTLVGNNKLNSKGENEMDKELYGQVFRYMTDTATELIVDYEFSKNELGKEESQVVEVFKTMDEFCEKNPGLRYGNTLGVTKEDVIRMAEICGQIVVSIGDLYGKLLHKKELNELENKFVENMNKISKELILVYNYTRNSLEEVIKYDVKTNKQWKG